MNANTTRYFLKDTDGTMYEGDTADEIVQKMSDTKFRPSKSLGSYRRHTAMRVKELFGKEIDWKTSESFIESMIRENLLEDLTDPH